MDTKIMKNTKNSLLKWILGAGLVAFGAQEALSCAGTAYIKVPSEWTDLYAYYGNESTKIPATAYDAASGYYKVDLTTLKGNDSYSFILYTSHATYSNIDYPGVWGISGSIYNNVVQKRPDSTDIACPGIDNVVYVGEDALNPGSTYQGSEPPGAKFFYFLVPDNEEWQSDNVMVSYDGKTAAMASAPNMCGWYYFVFEKAPDEVLVYRKNDPTDQLGVNGIQEMGEAQPIPLATMFDAFESSTLYFIPDEDDYPDTGEGPWFLVDPGVPAAEDNSRCTYKLAALIYDTDESLNDVFTSDGNNAGFGACTGVHQGIVKEDLDPIKKKPEFSGSANAVKCFGDVNRFNTLFNYTPGKNEVQCYDMPFRHYGRDTRWGFDSDSSVNDGYTGGFYPVEETSDLTVVNGMGPTPAARGKRKADAPVGVTVADFDYYCNTPGWFGGYDCGKTNMFKDGDTPAVWDWGKREDWKTVTRNQQFCFESHASFTYFEDQEFTFRGDDDIWVFINNKIAVDNGGAHLATPGHVVLKNLNTTYGAGFLEAGKDYDIDIFFCDRRTTMSNVIIKTNMYIKQKSDISLKPVRKGSETSYSMCYTETGASSCAAAMTGSQDEIECCGSEIGTKVGCENVTVNYYLVPGSKMTLGEDGVPTTEGYKAVLAGKSDNYGGIDLTDPTAPVINKSLVTLPPGKWTLYVVMNGKQKKIDSFRMAGEVDVVSGDAIVMYFDDGTGEEIPALRSSIDFVSNAMGSPQTPSMEDLVPVYVSAIAADRDATTGKLVVQPDDAVDVEYTLDAPADLTMYVKDGNTLTVLPNGTPRKIKESGIDTVYVTVARVAMTAKTQSYDIKVAGRSNPASITFFLPTLAFVDSTSGAIIKGESPLADGSYDEFWVGSYYPLHMVALKPDLADPAKAYPCDECNFTFTLGSETSPRIDAKDPTNLAFVDGKAVVQVRSLKEYRNDPTNDNPAKIVVVGDNALMQATYTPIYFREPPVPYPVLVDIFDASGATPETEMNIPAPYFKASQEYLDGIADSVTIYYNRPIHKDSIPTMICIEWESSTAESVNPYALGVSNKEQDSTMKCNVSVMQSDITCEAGADGYCPARLGLGGLKLSSAVKTAGDGTEILNSWAKFEDKGKIVTLSYNSGITDRIAPVITRAQVVNGEKSNVLTLTLSESITNLKSPLTSFTFYLNSATSLSEDLRFTTDVKALDVPTSAMAAAGKAVTLKISYDPSSGNVPHVGDYIRFSGDIGDVYWQDMADIAAPGSDTLRLAGDAEYYWNAPTAYDASSKRLPSPWTPVVGEAEVTVKEQTFAHTGNAPKGDNVPVVTVTPFATSKSLEFVLDSVGYIAGHFVQSDMFSAIYADEAISDYFTNNRNDLSEVFFYYNVEYFTNLGNYVASQSGKISCTDESIFGAGKTCMDVGLNYYIAWNMRSDDGREVATGAYITKLESYIHLGSKFGKKNALDRTSVWGVRRSATPYHK